MYTELPSVYRTMKLLGFTLHSSQKPSDNRASYHTRNPHIHTSPNVPSLESGHCGVDWSLSWSISKLFLFNFDALQRHREINKIALTCFVLQLCFL